MADNSVKYEVKETTPTSVHDDTPELPPYTMEELNARIDEAEEQIARGEVIDAEVFFRQMHERIAARS